MIVKLKVKGVEYDISRIVDPFSTQISKNIESQFDAGKIVISAVKANAIEGLDLSLRIPNYSEIFIDSELGLQETMYVLEDNCSEIIMGYLYKHEISLTELTAEIQLYNVPDNTTTQPQDGNYFSTIYGRSSLKLIETNKEEIFSATDWTGDNSTNGMLYLRNSTDTPFNKGVYNTGINTGIKVDSLQELSLETLEYTDSAIIEKNIVKVDGNYSLNLKLKVVNPSFNGSASRSYGSVFGLSKNILNITGVQPTLNVYIQAGDGEKQLIKTKQLAIATNASNGFTKIMNLSSSSSCEHIKCKVQTVEMDISASTLLTLSAGTKLKVWVECDCPMWTFKLTDDAWIGDDTTYVQKYRTPIYITEGSFEIYKASTTDNSPSGISLESVLKKQIALSDIDCDIEPETLERLRNTLSSEFTFTKFTLWDSLQEIAGMVGAVPRLIKINNRKVIKFDFFDDLENSEIIDPPNVQNKGSIRQADNYVSNLELNADNIVCSKTEEIEPFDTGWMSLRSVDDGNAKISTDNIGIQLPFNIYQIKQMEIKGIDCSKINSEFTKDKVWKLIDDYVYPSGILEGQTDEVRIVEKSYYDSFDSTNDLSNFTTRIAQKQNNMLYYIQGDNKIYGMSFTAQYKPEFASGTDEVGNRSLYEMIYTKALKLQSSISGSTSIPTSMNSDPGTVESDDDIKIRIKYIAYSDSRANIYKEDLSGFELPYSMKYYNETATVNDPVSLGSHTQGIINKLGNTNHSIYGTIKRENRIPSIGSRTSDNKILTAIAYQIYPNKINYIANYVKNFAVISDYVGIRSPHRQYEVPYNNIVTRKDKHRTHIFLDTKPIKNTRANIWLNNSLWNFLLFNYDGRESKSKRPKAIEVKPYVYKNAEQPINTFIRPVNVVPTGKTISIQYKMEDNYSAGKSKGYSTIDGNKITWQKVEKYVNSYGRVSRVGLKLVSDMDYSDDVKSLCNNYPVQVFDSIDYMSSYEYDVDKDAREIMSTSFEVSFHSNDVDNLILFDGISLYNSVVLQDIRQAVVKSGLYSGQISKSSKKIDLNKISGAYHFDGITGDVDNQCLNFIKDSGYGDWFVVYKEGTGELVFAMHNVDKDSDSIISIYFGTKAL